MRQLSEKRIMKGMFFRKNNNSVYKSVVGMVSMCVNVTSDSFNTHHILLAPPVFRLFPNMNIELPEKQCKDKNGVISAAEIFSTA